MSDESGPRQGSAAVATVSRAMLSWFGVAIVVLSFLAAFLGAWLARSTGAPSADDTPQPLPSASAEQVDYEEALAEILPAGSAVRVGMGAPESGKGYDGDVYIDVDTTDLYVFRDGDWQVAGNLKAEAVEHLTGATGPQGTAGPQGEPGPRGEPGTPGTQVLLGQGDPDPKTCTTEGDVYIDTESVAFFQCLGGQWIFFGPQPAAPTPTATAEPAPEPTDGG
ncbi:hypothetical protein GCM10009819_19390 [Agromyces tropicus]|uniref:Collagen-like protein n=1 Tax=Agromyces tropicus TaxID=555371 RepID=A0ABN2UGA4_9MICO